MSSEPFERAAAGVLAVALASAAPLYAQDASPPGWLGVTLAQQFECVWETTEDWKDCSLVMDVSGLQAGGPAARGGVELGDRLVAINGENVTYRSWPRLASTVRPGTPVSIDVMRDGQRHFVHVVPTPRPPDIAEIAWVRGEADVGRPGERRAFVFTLTELTGEEGVAFALTVRDTDADDVAVVPSAVRVVDGQLSVTPLDDRVFVELPQLRTELLRDLRQVSESTYRSASSALEVFDRIGDRLPSPEFRRRLARLAQVGLEQAELATSLRRSFAGARLEPVRRYSGRERLSGLLVLKVERGTLAERLGLRSGDVVIRAGRTRTLQIEQLLEAVEAAEGGLPVTWIRDGREITAVLNPD